MDKVDFIEQEMKMACADRKNIWSTLVKQDRQIVASRILLVVVIALMLVIGYRYVETTHRVDELEQWNLYLQEELNEVKTLQDMYIKGDSMYMYNEDEVCGTCKYHRTDTPEFAPEDIPREWYCDCDFGDYFGLPTEYDDVCSTYESRRYG